MENQKQIVMQSSPEFSADWLKHQRAKQAHPELYALRSTGIKSLDLRLDGGLEPGQYVLIGGPPKGGKTTLLLTMVIALASQGLNVAWFGAEMNTLQTGNIVFANMSGVQRSRIRAADLSPMDWEALEVAGEKISQLTSWWSYGFNTVEDIDHSLQGLSEKGIDIDVIVLDYLQLMDAPGIRGGRVEEITYISRQMKRRSIEGQKLRIVLAAAQLNRESVRQKLYDMQAWLGSGGLERDMDLGMVIHDTIDKDSGEKLLGQKEIEIVGSRETSMEDVAPLAVLYDGRVGRITDMTKPAQVNWAGIKGGLHENRATGTRDRL